MIDIKYSELLSLNRSLGKSMNSETYLVTILSNITISQFNEIFEYALRLEGINGKVNSGEYDNILQDSLRYNKSDLVVIFWELANIIDGLQYKANLMDDAAVDALVLKVCNEIDFIVDSLKNTSLVIFNKFSSLVFNHANLKTNTFDNICIKLNNYLDQKVNSNFILIDIDKVFAKISISKSIDLRYYYSSKALYSVEFYKHYSQYIIPVIRSVRGKAKKAIIFDCDNTLWKGILGEDGADRIEMSGKTKAGVVFEEVQNLALDLLKKGILIGLCSKNNHQDVETIIDEHPDMTIRNNNIAIKKVNWNDKATNLKEIAAELNIGLDSLVFVDDSEFETEYIKDTMPQITVLKVPLNLFEYPKLFRDYFSLFYNISQTKEDTNKTEMYIQEAKRVEEKSLFTDIDSYLQSFLLEITIYENSLEHIPRISQLTQKTNQFNLTTHRYTEADIKSFVYEGHYKVFAFDVNDKYGDYGLTGVCIVHLDPENKAADINSLLMSCRVIGRNIERAFFDCLISRLKETGIDILRSKYIKTYKNEQVSDFYDKLGFICTKDHDGTKEYEIGLSNLKKQNIDYIKVNYGTEN